VTQPANPTPTQPAPSTPAPAPADAATVQSADQSQSQSQAQSHGDSNSQPQSQSQPQAQPAQPQPLAADAVAAAPQSAPAIQATQVTQAALPTRYGVSLQHAVDAVHTTIELASRQGATQAKIELSPASLGTIRIQLHRTDDGVTAHVTTDSAATADTLSQGSDDLRRSLQSAGVNLVRLDIEARGDANPQTQDRAQDSSPRSHGGADSGQIDAIGETDTAQTEPTTVALPGGALVNVLA
jgi:flagellar hook-length control protein FliK